MQPFWGPGYRIYLPAIFVVIVLISVGLFFLYRSHPKWNKKIPIMVVYVLLLGGEIVKQVLVFKDHIWGCLPFSLCAIALFSLPFVIFLKKNTLLKRVAWGFSYILCLAVSGIMLTLPSTLFHIDPNGTFTDFIAIWGMVYHVLLMFLFTWFILYHPIQMSWKDFMWMLIIFISWMLLMVGITALVLYTTGYDLDFMMLWDGSWSASLSPPLHVLTMMSVYIGLSCSSFLIIKLVIFRYVKAL